MTSWSLESRSLVLSYPATYSYLRFLRLCLGKEKLEKHSATSMRITKRAKYLGQDFIKLKDTAKDSYRQVIERYTDDDIYHGNVLYDHGRSCSSVG